MERVRTAVIATDGGQCGGSAAGRTTSSSQMALQLPAVTVRAGTRASSPSDSCTICYTSTPLCLLPCGGLQFLSSTAHCPKQLCCGIFFLRLYSIGKHHIISRGITSPNCLVELILGSLSAPAQGDPYVTHSSDLSPLVVTTPGS